MKWKKGMPTKKGIYLRNNPASTHVVRQDIIDIGGVLHTNTSDHAGLVKLVSWPALATFWWYGPIPKSPEGE